MQKIKLYFVLLLFPIFLFAKEKTICLNMIVKNEKHVIERCLASVKPIIDYWVIVDTGSSDGTQEVIKKYMEDIPGELHERPWVNFGHNREEALQLAKKKADYLLFMDADDKLVFEDGFQMPLLDADVYRVPNVMNGMRYNIPRLVKNDLDWHWHGVLHEWLHVDGIKKDVLLPGVDYVCLSGGARSLDPEKYKKDAKVLQEAFDKEPHNERYAFYLAQSYLCAGDLEKAHFYYLKRASMGGWDQEVFYSLLKASEIQEKLDPNSNLVDEGYLKAFFYRPTRIEPLYSLVKRARIRGDYQKGYDLANIAMTLKVSDDAVFVEEWMYDYGVLFEQSICAYYIGKYQESINACDKLLLNPRLPEVYRNFTVSNKKIAEDKLSPHGIGRS